MKLIKYRDQIFRPRIDHVFVVYASNNCDQYADLLDDAGVELTMCNDPTQKLNEILEMDRHLQKLIFFDDFSTWLMKQQDSARLFLQAARHNNISLICSAQVLRDGKGSNIMSLLKNTDILTLHD